MGGGAPFRGFALAVVHPLLRTCFGRLGNWCDGKGARLSNNQSERNLQLCRCLGPRILGKWLTRFAFAPMVSTMPRSWNLLLRPRFGLFRPLCDVGLDLHWHRHVVTCLCPLVRLCMVRCRVLGALVLGSLLSRVVVIRHAVVLWREWFAVFGRHAHAVLLLAGANRIMVVGGVVEELILSEYFKVPLVHLMPGRAVACDAWCACGVVTMRYFVATHVVSGRLFGRFIICSGRKAWFCFWRACSRLRLLCALQGSQSNIARCEGHSGLLLRKRRIWVGRAPCPNGPEPECQHSPLLPKLPLSP